MDALHKLLLCHAASPSSAPNLSCVASYHICIHHICIIYVYNIRAIKVLITAEDIYHGRICFAALRCECVMMMSAYTKSLTESLAGLRFLLVHLH